VGLPVQANSTEDWRGEADRLRDHLRVVSEAAQTFAQATTDYERLLDSIARILSERIGDTCSVFLLSENQRSLRTVSMYATEPGAVHKIRQLFASEPILLDDHPVIDKTVQSGQALLVPRMSFQPPSGNKAEERAAAQREVGLHSFLLVPLRAHERCIGLLGLGRFKPSSPAFNEQDRELAQTLADHASQAIQNAQLYAAVRDARQVAEQAEERARHSEQTHRFFFESSPIPTFVFDVGTQRVLAANAAALSLYGYTLEEFLTLTVDDLRLPEERAALQQALLAAGEAIVKGTGSHRKKDGTVIFVEGRTHQIMFDGRLARYAVVQDQTQRFKAEAERREVEGRLQRTLDMMMEGYTILGHDLTYLYVNEVGARQARLAKQQLVGRTPMQLFPDFEKSGMYGLLTRCLRERVPLRMEEELTLADDSKAYFEVNILPIPEGLVILSIDATERRRTERAREALEEQLRQSQRMDAVGRLAGGIAHDFNNILSIILGYGETLLEDMDREDPKRADVHEMHKAAGRAAELTKQLLMFSRQQLVEPKVLDLNEVLGSMHKMLRRLVGEHIELCSLSDTSLGRIKADRGNIEQVIMNLVVNARDAMPRGGKLTIETANTDLDETFARTHLGAAPGPYVLLAVTDTGSGMDKATRSRIFEPFFTTKEQGKGTGLGLSTVFGIVKQSRGGIWVYSEPDHGTTFKVYLPRTRAELELDRASLLPADLRGSETILLCEDEEAVRGVAQRMLERQGYRVIVARDTADALLLAEQNGHDIDLLLTDVVMPKMSGAALATRLTAKWPRMKVLYVSGYTDGTVVAHGILEQNGSFLQKPFTSDQLARKLRTVLSAPVEAARNDASVA
jgi:two-component system cell cycle sensor histidine kinase/response regulator CckA